MGMWGRHFLDGVVVVVVGVVGESDCRFEKSICVAWRGMRGRQMQYMLTYQFIDDD